MSGNGRKLWLKKSLTWVNKTYVPIQGRRCQSMLCGSRILKLNITNMTIKSSRQENSVWQFVTRYATLAARTSLPLGTCWGWRAGESAKLQTLFSQVFMSGSYLTSLRGASNMLSDAITQHLQGAGCPWLRFCITKKSKFYRFIQSTQHHQKFTYSNISTGY